MNAPLPTLVREPSGLLVLARVAEYAIASAAVSDDDGTSWTDQDGARRANCLYPTTIVVTGSGTILPCFDFEGRSPAYRFDSSALAFEAIGSIPTQDVTGFTNRPTAAAFGSNGVAMSLDAEGAWFYSLDGGFNWSKGFDLSTAPAMEGQAARSFGVMAGDGQGLLHVLAGSSLQEATGYAGEYWNAHLVLDVPAGAIAWSQVLHRYRFPPEPASGELPSVLPYVNAAEGGFAFVGGQGHVALTSGSEDVLVGRFAWQAA